jgi:hypothetical protein
MEKELDDKLVKKYPLLYADRNKSMMETCMCWGFPGSGWYSLIDELSAKLEKLIEEYLKENPNSDCYRCGCPKEEHYGYKSYDPGKCLVVKKKLTRWAFKWRTFKSLPRFLNRFLSKTYSLYFSFRNKVELTFFPRYQTCHCEKYEECYPRASQVKEKFGTLRFYMISETDEMSKLISEAEAKSAITCEFCGEPGELRNTGWYITLCDKCHEKRKEDMGFKG